MLSAYPSLSNISVGLAVRDGLGSFVRGCALTLACAAFCGPGFAQGVPGKGTWETTLLPRDLDNDGVVDAFYDTSLNITWLADFSGPATGQMPEWSGAMDMASSMVLYGRSGWRLPRITPVNGVSFQYPSTTNGTTDDGWAITGVGWGRASELGYLYYVTLGNYGFFLPSDNPADRIQQPGWVGTPNSGPFQNLRPDGYFTQTLYELNPQQGVMGFNFNTGAQTVFNRCCARATFVLDGDIAAVPDVGPRESLVMGLSLLLLLGARKGPARKGRTI